MRIASTESTASSSPPISAASTAAASMLGEPFERIAVEAPRALSARKIGRESENGSSVQYASSNFGRSAVSTEGKRAKAKSSARCVRVQKSTGKRQRPTILKLLDPPDFGEPVGIGTRGRAVPGDGGVHVEERPIGVEDESAWHRGPSASEPRLGQQSRKRPSTDVVEAGIDHAIAHDLGQQRGVEFG